MEYTIDAIETKQRNKFNATAWMSWITATLFAVYLFNIQTGYSIVSLHVQHDLSLSLADVGTVVSVYTFVIGFCQFFAGPLLDSIGIRRVILPSIFIVSMGIAILGTADSMEVLLVGQIVLAVGGASAFIGAGYLGGKCFGSDKYGIMFGFVQTIVTLFSAIGQIGIFFALNYIYWRDLAIYGSYIGIAILCLGIFFISEPKSAVRPRGRILLSIKQNLGAIITIPHMWILAFWGSISFGCQLALGTIWAPRLMSYKGLTPFLAILASAMVWGGLAVGCCFWNIWSEKIKSRKIPAATGLFLQIVFISLLLFVRMPTYSEVLCLFFAGLGASTSMTAFTAAADLVPVEQVATSASFINGFMFFISTICVALPGYTEAYAPSLRHAFAPLLGFLALALVVVVFQKETFGVARANRSTSVEG